MVLCLLPQAVSAARGQGTGAAHRSLAGNGSFETGHRHDHRLPESACEYESHSAGLPYINNFA